MVTPIDIGPGGAPLILPDLPIADYVADPCVAPSLSASVAHLLTSRTAAHAFVKHPRLTPQKAEEWSASANFGSAVHSLVFGGPKVQRYGYPNWKKKEAQEDKANCLAVGEIPLLMHDYERARAIVKIVQEHPCMIAEGLRESTIVWREGETLCRTRPDIISADMRDILDLKVTGTNAADCNRQFFSMGYDMQAAFMERGADAVDPLGRGRREITYLFVEDELPFAVVPLRVSESTLHMARKRFDRALALWEHCTNTKEWPAYPAAPVSTEVPGWLENKWIAEEAAA